MIDKNPNINNIPDFIISPPFGSYFKENSCLSVKGTFTLEPRNSKTLWRLQAFGRAILTLRYIGNSSWCNKIGLRNSGINNAKIKPNDIISIASLEDGHWQKLASIIYSSPQLNQHSFVEINVGCPNVLTKDFTVEDIEYFDKERLIIKLPPVQNSLNKIKELITCGATIFHMSNTVYTPNGGISGREQKKINLELIKSAKDMFGNQITIIAGGGIYSINDIKDYKALGVKNFSLSTLFFNPFKAKKLITNYKRDTYTQVQS